MAITDKTTGPWGLDQVYNKINQGSIWEYSGSAAAYAWGYNQVGTLGQNDRTQRSSPVQIPGTTWTQVRVRYQNTGSFGLKNDGTLWAWGDNDDGKLGLDLPSDSDRSSPTQIPGTTWSRIRGSKNGGMATKTDGTLWVWGMNGQGNLGQNNRTTYSSPRQVPGTWSNNFDNGDGIMLGVKSDGTLWGWGAQAERGTLGQNQGGGWYRYSSPVQIPGTTWSTTAGALDVDSECAAVIKTDGTLWCWGRNSTGRCGPASPPGGNNGFSSPVQVPGTTWSQVASGNYNTIAIKTDGTLWVWGANHNGAHGLNNTAPDDTVYRSPLQIGSDTDWSQCDMAKPIADTKSALKTDGTLWVWGRNRYGQLGQNKNENSQEYYSSPTQIPGTWAHAIDGETANGAAQIL